MTKAVVNSKIITDREILLGYNIIFNKKIVSITKKVPKNMEIIDAKGAYLSAGFIDIHIHGSGGADIMDSSFESLNLISKTILQTGTTSFLATTMTMSNRKIIDALNNISYNINRVDGAKVLGVHLEGPFINPKRAGAQNIKYIQRADFKLISNHIDIIKLITIAPELDGAKEFISYIKERYPNIVISIGHSDANYMEAKRSFNWGVSHATHLFNAMASFHHREPATVGAVLEDSRVSCEIIADNIHIHPSFYSLIYRLKPQKLMLITDSMRAGCMRSGEYSLGGQRVIVKDNRAELENGVLAGSVLRLNSALKNFHRYTDIKLVDLIKMVTLTPAKKLGLDSIGQIEEDYIADMVLFDNEFNIIKTFIDGKLKYG